MMEVVLLKATLLLLLCWTLACALRRRSAATRHFLWCAGLFGCAALAVVEMTAPPVKVMMPAREESGVASSGLRERPRVSPPATRNPQPATPVKGDAGAPLPLLWGAGALAVAAWFAIGHIALARVVRRAAPADGFRFSEEVSAPVTWRNVILLPAEARQWPEERRRAALLHERAHVARYDFLTQTLAQLVVALYWFHPLVWLAFGRVRAESEHACDDRVLAGGMAAPDYATHLLAVARGAMARRQTPAGVGMARPSQFERRLVAVLDESRARGVVSRGTAVIASMLVALVLVPVVVADPENPKKDRGGQQSSGRREARHYTFATAPGDTLTLDLKTGASLIVAGGRDDHAAHVTVTGDLPDDRDIRLSVRPESGGLRIATEYAGRKSSYSSHMKLRITVPRRYNLNIDSAGGEIMLLDLEGTFRGTTGGGQIVLDRLRGVADLTTGGGDVRVTDSVLDGDVSTGGGEVRIERTRGNLNGASGSGEVRRDRSGADEPTRIEKSGGDVYLPEAHDVIVSTGGGEIEIDRGSGTVDVSTGGGDITLRAMSGSVRATTGNGDVEVAMLDGGGAQIVDVSTAHGGVVLELPADFDARLELETSYTRGFERETRIASDWPLERDGPGAWDASRGTPRRILRARGTIGSGRGLVRVSAINGDVVVRRK